MMVDVRSGPFATREAAEEFKRDYIDCWPPEGYSTSLQIVQEPKRTVVEGSWGLSAIETLTEWRVTGFRATSCD